MDDIDYYVGGLLEKPLPDGTLGQSFACIQAESFFRWKFGDRMFYEFSQTRFSLGMNLFSENSIGGGREKGARGH